MLGQLGEPVEGEQVEDVDGLQVVLFSAGLGQQVAQVAVEVLQSCVVFLELFEATRLEVVEGAGFVVGAWVSRAYARRPAGLFRARQPGRGCRRWPGAAFAA